MTLHLYILQYYKNITDFIEQLIAHICMNSLQYFTLFMQNIYNIVHICLVYEVRVRFGTRVWVQVRVRVWVWVRVRDSAIFESDEGGCDRAR